MEKIGHTDVLPEFIAANNGYSVFSCELTHGATAYIWERMYLALGRPTMPFGYSPEIYRSGICQVTY